MPDSLEAAASEIARADGRRVDRDGRHEERDHRVDPGVLEDDRHDGGVEAVGGRPEHVDGIRGARLRGHQLAEPRLGLRRERRKLQPRGLAGVGAQDPETTGVRDHGDAVPARGRLAREERGDVEQLGERLGPDHARLAEQRVDRGVGAGQRGRVGARRATTGARAAALHREHRLLAGEPPRDAGELARVAERLDVHQDEIRLVVVLPPLEEVVGGDVGLVPDRDERRDAEPSRLCAFEQREAERSALRGEADAPTGERPRCERRVEPDRGRRDAEAVRADEPCAVRADERQELVLAFAPFGADLREACRDHAERARPVT